MTDQRNQCVVRDGRFVDACLTLAKATDNNMPGFSRIKAISRWEMTNINTGDPSRTYYGVKSKQFPNGISFNTCPFCGTDISAPFTPKGCGAA